MNQQQVREWRRQGIGGSDAPVIEGVSPWKTPFQLWEEKCLGVFDEKDNPSMAYGRSMEEPIRQEFEKLTGLVVAPDRLIHPDHCWLRISMDGLDITGKCSVEIKSANKEDHELAKAGKVPLKYHPQNQHYYNVHEKLDKHFYFSHHKGDYALVEVARERDFIGDMRERQRKFWDLVLQGKPPELTEKDFLLMEDGKEWSRKAKELKELKALVKDLEKGETLLQKELKLLSQGRNAKDSSISFRKSICQGAIDYKQAIEDYLSNMRAHYPEVTFPEVAFEPYRKDPIEKWTLKVI
jgi:putative phage-type endonuclease